MFWNDVRLREWAGSGHGIQPFAIECINPASVDLRWSGKYRIANKMGWGEVRIAKSLTLKRGEFYLLDTLETITMPDNAVGWLALKSSMGRSGLEHLHAGFFDPGFRGTATLEVENRAPWPLTIERKQRIIQIALCDCEVPERSYQIVGRYNDQADPEPSRMVNHE